MFSDQPYTTSSGNLTWCPFDSTGKQVGECKQVPNVSAVNLFAAGPPVTLPNPQAPNLFIGCGNQNTVGSLQASPNGYTMTCLDNSGQPVNKVSFQVTGGPHNLVLLQ